MEQQTDNIVDIDSKHGDKQIELSKEERLELENMQLKFKLFQSEWGNRVSERIGDDIRQYRINVNTGICTREDVRPNK